MQSCGQRELMAASLLMAETLASVKMSMQLKQVRGVASNSAMVLLLPFESALTVLNGPCGPAAAPLSSKNDHSLRAAMHSFRIGHVHLQLKDSGRGVPRQPHGRCRQSGPMDIPSSRIVCQQVPALQMAQLNRWRRRIAFCASHRLLAANFVGLEI